MYDQAVHTLCTGRARVVTSVLPRLAAAQALVYHEASDSQFTDLTHAR